MSRGPCRRQDMTGGVGQPHTPLGTTDLDPLYAELRALARPTRAVIDAYVAGWYVESRGRIGRPYDQWNDPAVREVASAVFFGAGGRAGCRRLGEARAAAGWSEHELRADLVALTRSFGLGLSAAGILMAAARDGYQAATTTIVVDLIARGRARPGVRVYDAVERVAGGHEWSELAPATRFAVVVPRDRRLPQRAAAVRAGLRMAPELTGVDAWVWTEPRSDVARRVVDRAIEDAPPPGARRRSRRRPVTAHGRVRMHGTVAARRFERLSAVAVLAVVVVAAASVMRGPGPLPERPSGPSGADGVQGALPPAAIGPEPRGVPAPTYPPDLQAVASPARTSNPPEPVVELPTAPVAHVEPTPAAAAPPPSPEPVGPSSPPPPRGQPVSEQEPGAESPEPSHSSRPPSHASGLGGHGPPPHAGPPAGHGPPSHASGLGGHGPPAHAGK